MTEELIREWVSDINATYMKLNSFWGGKNKRCIQLSINTGVHACYIQMTYGNARDFFKEAIKQIDDIEARYNESPPWWEEIDKSIINGGSGTQ